MRLKQALPGAVVAGTLVALLGVSGARGQGPGAGAAGGAVGVGFDIDAKARTVAKSIVIVDFTIRTENGSREDSGQGIIVSKEGVILISGNLIDEGYPKEWIAEIKVRLPGKNFAGVPAKMLGRTRNRLFAYLKTTQPIDDPVFSPDLESAPVGAAGATTEGAGVPGTAGGAAGNAGPKLKLGQQVFGVARAGTGGGYETYIGKSEIRAIVDYSHVFVSTASFGLTRGTSPVFDAESGQLVGITLPSLGDTVLLRDSSGASRRVDLVDEDQSSAFLPMSEVAGVLKDVPTEPFDLRRPWLAVDDIKGLQEDVRENKKIEQPSGVIITSAVTGEAADKAGLKGRDIVLSVDGKEFSHSPVPEMMVLHFSRVIDQLKPGDKVTLGVLRDGKKLDVPVTLGTRPRVSGEMTHVFSPRVGIVTRDLVFWDAYARHLPQDTKGVMVALVKNNAPAALSSTPLRAGFLITKVGDEEVQDQKQFLDIMKREEAKADLKEMVFVVIQPNGETQVCRVDLTK